MQAAELNEYRARRLGGIPRTSYISFSKIKLILEAKEYFWAGYSRNRFRAPTWAMLESKHIDLLLLEPELYKRTVAISPFKNFMTREAQKWKDETLKLNPAALIITDERAKQDLELQDAVMSNPEVDAIFKDLDWLRCGYATDPEYGLLYVEPDLRTKSTQMIGDIKAIESIDRFHSQIEFMKWYVQLGFYGHGNMLINGVPNRDNKFFLGIEKEFPYRNGIFTLRGDYDTMADVVWKKGAGLIREMLAQDPTLQNRALWFQDSYTIRELSPTYKHVNYGEHAEDFSGLQLGGG